MTENEHKAVIDRAVKEIAPPTLAGKIAELSQRSILMANLRHVLSAVGGVLLALGYLPDVNASGKADGADVEMLIGASMIVVSVVSSVVVNLRGARKKQILQQAVSIAPTVIEAAKGLVATKNGDKRNK